MTLLRLRAIEAATDEYVVRAHVVSFKSYGMQTEGVSRFVVGTRLYLTDGRTLDIPSPVEEIQKAMVDPPPEAVG